MSTPNAPEHWTFEQAMEAKNPTFREYTDAQWYVALVVQCCQLYEGLSPGNFMFNINPPNPEIKFYFDRKVPPHICAIELFSTRQ